MKINETIRSRRKQLGLTQEQVASRLGVTATAVYKWEVGSCYPDITLLPALAKAAGGGSEHPAVLSGGPER